MDAYELLGLTRMAALDAGVVRDAFQRAAAACHPDGGGTEGEKGERTARFQELNAAAAILTGVGSRVRHLLALEAPGHVAERAASMDEKLVALFMEVGQAVRGAGEWAEARRKAETFLAKAGLAGRELEVREGLEGAGAAVKPAMEELESGLAAVDAMEPGAAGRVEWLAALGQRAGFLEKWQAQLQGAWSLIFSVGG
ncbi:MAG: hypothetical protein JWL81_2712 [Verrucomicrobiales bacterium]|nr:hypothetical protein [Verrucomicrobiales bacterium]